MKKVLDNKKLDVVFIIDRSGSMAGSEENTISSFNEYLEKEKKNKFDTYVSTILFSDTYKEIYKRKKVSEVKKLTKDDYIVGGCTALYDALGNSINNMEKYKNDKVLFIIITDGYENASLEYKKDNIKELIKSHNNWEFIYIGADIDSYESGADIGIRKDNIANFKKDKKGTSLLFKSIGNFEACMMGDEGVMNKASWKEDLEKYIDENKNNL